MASAAQSAKEAGFDSQYLLLKDGDASKSDYDEALAQMASCLLEKGLKPEPGYVNKVDSLTMIVPINYGDVPDSDAATIVAECFESKKVYVEAAYLATHTPVMDAALLEQSVSCIESKGIKLTGSENNLAALHDSAGSGHRMTVDQCIGDANTALYPGTVISTSG